MIRVYYKQVYSFEKGFRYANHNYTSSNPTENKIRKHKRCTRFSEIGNELHIPIHIIIYKMVSLLSMIISISS